MSASHQIVCGQCGKINRLPAERAATNARCGSCHQPIFSGHPIEVDEEAFDRHLAHNDIPVLVDVWAPWCGPAVPWRRCSNARHNSSNPGFGS